MRGNYNRKKEYNQTPDWVGHCGTPGKGRKVDHIQHIYDENGKSIRTIFHPKIVHPAVIEGYKKMYGEYTPKEKEIKLDENPLNVGKDILTNK